MASNNLNNIKTRLLSIKSTKKITNAMKLVASSRERKLASSFKSGLEYNKNVENIFNNSIFINKLNPDVDKLNNFLFNENNESEKVLHVVITSNTGLCSGYNIDIIHHLNTIYKSGDDIIVIGEKGKIELAKDDTKFIDSFIDISKKVNLFSCKKLSEYLINEYKNKKYKEIDVVYAHYYNSILYKVQKERLLPIKLTYNSKRNYSPIYLPDKEELINLISNEYLSSSLYRIILDALWSEESSRRNAMDNATKNADDLIDKLTLEFNKARQEQITTEINEVVSGSKASK